MVTQEQKEPVVKNVHKKKKKWTTVFKNQFGIDTMQCWTQFLSKLNEIHPELIQK